MAKYYTLIDAVEMNQRHPATFSIPSDADIAALTPGDFVKLFFVPTEEALKEGAGITERMWVKITDMDAPRGEDSPLFLSGTLANEPFVFDGMLKFGDFVSFAAWNIASIARKEES